MSTRLVLATHNAHKLEEFRRLISPQIDAYDGPEPVEPGVTFAENALIKARAAAEFTGLPSLADDSGLSVEVMGGSPGILSARWGGPERSDAHNRELLLWQLADIPDGHRQAEFVCALALVMPSGLDGGMLEQVVHGRWKGTIAHAISGEQGFGYDPLFIPEGEQRTAGELDPSIKDAQSHRARAIAAMLPILRSAGLV